ncbi:hypothetical protein Ccrd_020167, partial [Cynara cardunculus var. scolymus]
NKYIYPFYDCPLSIICFTLVGKPQPNGQWAHYPVADPIHRAAGSGQLTRLSPPPGPGWGHGLACLHFIPFKFVDAFAAAKNEGEAAAAAMRDGNSKSNKFSWSRKLVRKWFNIKSKTEESEADNVVSGGGDGGWMSSFCEREPPAIKKTKTEKSSKSTESRRWGRVDLDHPQVINVQNYSIFSATWNVGGKSPSSKMNLDDWLHAAPPADIYVLGYDFSF